LKFTANVAIPGTASTDNRKTLTLTQASTPSNGTNAGRGEIRVVTHVGDVRAVGLGGERDHGATGFRAGTKWAAQPGSVSNPSCV